jgi:uncharacterized membrane protein
VVVRAVTRAEGTGTASGFLWHDGEMTDLSRVPGFANSVAAGINREGRVVGYSYNLPISPIGFQSWFWQDDRYIDISNTLWPVSMNESGQVAGFTEDLQSCALAPRRSNAVAF